MTDQNSLPRRRKKTKKFRYINILRNAFIVLIALLLVTVISAGVYFSLLSRQWERFDPSKLENIRQTSFIYSFDDKPITSIHGTENRIIVSLNKIPKHVRDAFIAVEDVRFYEHHGFDLKRIVGALIQDIKAGGYVQGASTITQQVIRNSHLTKEKTISRKLQEIYLAYQLEQKYSKDQILEMYLNLIYFGKGAYGVEAASKLYFGKSIEDISIAEGAVLASIPKNPSKYSPFANFEESENRKNLVISLMVKHHFISPEEGENAKNQKIKLAKTEDHNYPFGYFMDMVIQEAVQNLSIDEKELMNEGYRIYTTLDIDLQKEIENLYMDDNYFPKSPITGESCESALVVLDSAGGEIRALMGGRKYETRKGLNRALQSKRQPGSAIKPILVYSPAIESFDYTPVTFIDDSPVTYGDYSPSNYGGRFHGLITLRTAVANSINIPAVKTLYNINIKNGIAFAKKLGIPFSPQDNHNLAIALGGFSKGVTPLELARAYTALADKGRYKDYSTIRRIEDPYGVTLYERKVTKTQVMKEETAFLMSNILRSTVQWGTAANKLSSFQEPLAAKTGTVQLPAKFGSTQGTKDVWIVAYNPSYVVTVWMGFDITDKSHYLPSNVVGGNYPGEIAKQVYTKIFSSRKVDDFTIPSHIRKVTLDSKSLSDFKQVRLATSLTPSEYIVSEYFTEGTVPTQESEYWVLPQTPSDFRVIEDETGFPVISFTPQDTFAAYDIYRITPETSEPAVVQRIQTGNLEEVVWKDLDVVSGGTYGYYIIPIHPELLIDNTPAEGASTPIQYIHLSDSSLFPDAPRPDIPLQESPAEGELPTIHLELDN